MIHKETQKGNSYWNQTGAYQKEYDQLWKQLVPSNGTSSTVIGELIRCGGRLLYEYCNNGNCNAVETEYETDVTICYCCNGTGKVEEYDYETDQDTEVICQDCYGYGEIEEDVEGNKFITDYYKDMLSFLKLNMDNKKTVLNLEKFMLGTLGYSSYTFNDDEMKPYNDLIDAIMYQVTKE
jgi:hypothetical protein